MKIVFHSEAYLPLEFDKLGFIGELVCVRVFQDPFEKGSLPPKLFLSFFIALADLGPLSVLPSVISKHYLIEPVVSTAGRSKGLR